MQTDWGGEYQKLHSFEKVASHIMSRVLMLINKTMLLNASITT
jgi:hypothetical protein